MATSPISRHPSSPTSAPSTASSRSSPPPITAPKSSNMTDIKKRDDYQAYLDAKARVRNARTRIKGLRDRKKAKRKMSEAQLEESKRALDRGLKEIEAFGRHLMTKSQVLGRVGTGIDGASLGDHQLELAKQPDSMTGGTMKDYQLEGLTWMYQVALQKQCGILADEMGLGKTVQAISWLTTLRDMGMKRPHLVVCPLSTLDNWIAEINMWTPTMPAMKYHGNEGERDEVYEYLMSHYDFSNDSTDEEFPIVCTTFEMLSRDQFRLAHFGWDQVFIDEGHRIKNCDSKVFDDLAVYPSKTRFLLTGTPLQNSMKELYSLMNFLHPAYFNSWEAFDACFNLDDVKDESKTKELIEDESKHGKIKKVHFILHSLMLRRVKADVLQYLPKKREYILYAPMTTEQLELYQAFTDKNINARQFLEDKVVQRMMDTAKSSTETTPEKSLAIRASPRKKGPIPETLAPTPEPAKNAFSLMMGKRGRGRPKKNAPVESKPSLPSPAPSLGKRKASPISEPSDSKSAKTSRESTPGQGRHTRTRARKYVNYDDLAASDDDDLSDDEFEARLVAMHEEELKQQLEEEQMSADFHLAKSYEMAKKEIALKKFGNPQMQVRLVCNSPHNFYCPWAYNENVPVDETIITASGKMLLLDRLLKALFKCGHKVLIFSQFVTQLNILQDYCEFRGYKNFRLDGQVPLAERQDMIEKFKQKKSKVNVFLLSTRAGGLGITLTAADTVILFDSDWNPQQDLQAQDRCHRISQTKPVIVYRLATKGTIEEDLLHAAAAKRRLEKLVIKKGNLRNMGRQYKDAEAEKLDKEELRALLLKDGKVFKYTGGQEILSDADLEVLCDRSPEAYERAAKGEGNARGFEVVETGAHGVQRAGVEEESDGARPSEI